MTVDWQQIVTFLLVALAFVAVGRRMWAQVRAFGKPRRRASATRPPAPTETPLMQIQLRPPARLTRERDEES